MKLALHVGQVTQPIPGGIGRYTKSLIKALPKDEVTLYTFACADPPVDAPPRYKKISRLNYRLEYSIWHRFRSRDVDCEGDLLHAPSLAVPPAKSRPLVVTVHDIAFLRHPGAFSRRGVHFHTRGLAIARKEAAAIIVPSRFTHDELVREGVDPALIHVIPHGIDIEPDVDTTHDTDIVTSLGVPSRFVLAVGTLEPRKNLPMLVRAVDSLRNKGEDLALVLVGPRGWGEVKGLDHDFVYEVGRVSDEILNALMRQAIVYCVPSIYEGFGMPALEAMSRNTAVIAAGVASLPEVVGDAGVLLDPLDSAVWANAIERMSTDEEYRKAQAQRGLVRAKSFTWDSSARAHVAAYREALRHWRTQVRS
ncbi:MAG TPA: glycosyltransferase family 1 protein [Acidimicrobiia bacterium]|nr:glycosyltransferase family 1 protein [Acidimicrobiia bacterium]